MRVLTRLGLLLGILLLGIADILVYWNSHLFIQAEKTAELGNKIELLRQANRLYPLNDLAYYGLGKACLDKGAESLGPNEPGRALIAEAVANFKQAIRLNPTSPFSHFYLAQALFQQNSLSGSTSDTAYLEEYKRAAELAAPNTQIYSEVGKAYLSLWSKLSEKEKSYALDMARKIFEGKNEDRIISLLNTWELNAGDFEIVERLLPSDARIFRLYANYLGERSLALGARQKALAQAESLEFQQAKAELESGEREAFYGRRGEAVPLLKTCLGRLEGIAFYQDLVSQALIDPAEYTRVRGETLLYLAECDLEQGRPFSEVESGLREYLNLDQPVSKVSELGEYLIRRHVVNEKILAKFDDLPLLYFQLLLAYKQNRYAEIIDIGRRLQESFVVVPGEKKNDYVRVLQVLGDADLKADYLYEGLDFYQKALDLEPGNLETLVRLRQNYEELNNRAKVQEINLKINEIIPDEINLRNFLLEKGQSLSRPLVLDGRKARFDLFLQAEGVPPLISVFFNERVAWENYVSGEKLTLDLKSRVGKNILRITSLNRSLYLVKLSRQPGSEEKIITQSDQGE